MEIIKAYCNKCCGERNQEILHREHTRWSEDVDYDIDYRYSIYGEDTYDMIKCCGCENIALRHISWCSEDLDEREHIIERTMYYPPATFRQEPRWLSEPVSVFLLYNSFLSDLLKEIYVALRNDLSRLAVMGIRALIEQVMVDKVGDQGSFKKNLDKFQVEGFISKSQRSVLEPVLEAGHATMHRSFNPSRRDLVPLIDVTENIIESIYVNERRIEEIKKKIPPRR